MTTSPAFDDESGPLVQPAGGGVVRPHLEVDLVRAVVARPRNALVEEFPAETLAAKSADERHAEMGMAAVDVDLRESDNPFLGHGDDRELVVGWSGGCCPDTTLAGGSIGSSVPIQRPSAATVSNTAR